jgi:N-acetylglutamate synthase-like GNAT family acetyltransferase
MRLKIIPVEQPDYAALATVLAENNLLAGDLQGDHKRFFAFQDTSGWRVGVGGLELYGEAAILRSFITMAHHRGQGLGGQMLEELLGVARQVGVRDVYLFTMDAEEFFARHGFARAERSAAPDAIQGSRQFGEQCSKSTFMHRLLPA